MYNHRKNNGRTVQAYKTGLIQSTAKKKTREILENKQKQQKNTIRQ